MGIGEKFKSMHLDVLREIGNIGAGNAATALSCCRKENRDESSDSWDDLV